MQSAGVCCSLVLLLVTLISPSLAYTETTVYNQYEDAVLYCSNDTDEFFNMSVTPTRWMLPNLTILTNSTWKFDIRDDFWTLLVKNVTEYDLGQYHCMTIIEDTGEWYLVKLGLNTRGPYFQDLWKKYELNTIIGLSAAGGFTILAIATILIYKFRWVNPDDHKSFGSSITMSSSSCTTESKSHRKNSLKDTEYHVNNVFGIHSYEDLTDTRF